MLTAEERSRDGRGWLEERASRLAVLAVLAFLALTCWRLDRFPLIHSDEPWILSPGYKLFTRGVYGSDLYSGLLGIESHYPGFMPLMPVLEGAAVSLLGLGVWQMRIVAALFGALTLLLSFRVARQLEGSLAGIITLLLLLFWQWRPSGDGYFATGVPLVDLSRIARYDIPTAPLGLGAFLCFLRGRRRGAAADYFMAGLAAGLAGLSHLYGLFWIVALLALVLAFHRLGPSVPAVGRNAALLFAGAVAAWIPWLAFVAAHWHDFVRQAMLHRSRFDLLSLSFYASNLRNEVSRYHLDLWNPQTLARPGFWLLVLGVPAALLWLSRRARRGDRQAIALLVPSLVLPSLFALLISGKAFTYVISFLPLFAIVVASLISWLLESPKKVWRIGARVVLALTVLQGGYGIAQMHEAARRAISPQETFRALRRVIPPSSRVLGTPEHWLALADRDYRSFNVLSRMWRPIVADPVPLEEALRRIAPDFVVLKPSLPPFREGPLCVALSTFMNEHHAKLILELRDFDGEILRVYQIGRAEAAPRADGPPARPRGHRSC